MMKSQDKRKKLKKLVHKQKGKCSYCRKPIKADKRTVDHVIPRAKGGTDTMKNLVMACEKCNKDKKDLTVEEFKEKLNVKI